MWPLRLSCSQGLHNDASSTCCHGSVNRQCIPWQQCESEYTLSNASGQPGLIFVWKLFLWYRKRTFQINCQWTMSISMDCLQLYINQPDVWIVNTKAVIPNEMCQRCKYVYWLCLVRPPMLFWEHSIRREELRTATEMAVHVDTF